MKNIRIVAIFTFIVTLSLANSAFAGGEQMLACAVETNDLDGLEQALAQNPSSDALSRQFGNAWNSQQATALITMVSHGVESQTHSIATLMGAYSLNAEFFASELRILETLQDFEDFRTIVGSERAAQVLPYLIEHDITDAGAFYALRIWTENQRRALDEEDSDSDGDHCECE